jgi:hypothetical protein
MKMVMAMLRVRVFENAPPLEVAIVLVIAAMFVWALWVGARSGTKLPPGSKAGGERDSRSA